jgi:hypothetical protein
VFGNIFAKKGIRVKPGSQKPTDTVMYNMLQNLPRRTQRWSELRRNEELDGMYQNLLHDLTEKRNSKVKEENKT